jgi:hypothetical protein
LGYLFRFFMIEMSVNMKRKKLWQVLTFLNIHLPVCFEHEFGTGSAGTASRYGSVSSKLTRLLAGI